jgi:hypothetical protein
MLFPGRVPERVVVGIASHYQPLNRGVIDDTLHRGAKQILLLVAGTKGTEGTREAAFRSRTGDLLFL